VKKCLIDGQAVLCDMSTGQARPPPWRPKVFATLHNIAHLGIRASRRLVSARYVWPGMAADIAEMFPSVQDCGPGKVHSQATAVAQPIPVPARQFAHLHVDLVGRLPCLQAGHTYLMRIIDWSTRWFEA
jgi:hypothetical protein